jgi:uncharacterized membrane protein
VLALLLGLILFFAAHGLLTLRTARAKLIRHVGGEGPWKLLFSAVSAVGLALIVWGYSVAPTVNVWFPPVWTRHLALLLMLPAAILIVAAYAPTGRIKATVKHPMLTSVKLWALAHLLANGDLASIILFGSFLAFGAYDRISVARRERAGEILAPAVGPARNDAVAVAVGLVLYLAIILWLHRLVIGVPVLP